MKKMKRIVWAVIVLAMLMVSTCYAMPNTTWEELSDPNRESVLLTDGETTDTATTQDTARGQVLASGILQITNNADGTLYVSVDTYSYKVVDKIYQTVFLDKWNESEERWVQVGYWDFERSLEEEEDLSYYHVGFTVTGCELNCYYRARALHFVQWGDDMEGKSTQTNGVLLTDHEI